MELWIRSQDKEILLKINELETEANMIIAFDGNKYQCLGTYKSKERALEILDEIQEHIQKQGQSYILTDEKGLPAGLRNYGNIYEMPEK